MTIDESISALRAADPEQNLVFTIIETNRHHPEEEYKRTTCYMVLATAKRSCEQYSSFTVATLEAATEKVLSDMRAAQPEAQG